MITFVEKDYKLFYECYSELVKLGFDFDKNSARDFIDCIMYLYRKYKEEDSSNYAV